MMKSPIVVLCFFLTAIVSLAQVKPESSSHLSFKGVPIDGTLREYVQKMEKNGFTQIGVDDGIALLQGDFAAYKNCTVGVATLKQKDLVSKITVIFPELDTWSSLYGNYSALKEMLTEKYGKPSDCVEEFDGRQPSDDNHKMFLLQMDNCKYYTIFETDKGRIELSIEHEGISSFFVMLAYFDKINGEAIRSTAMDDL